MAIIYLSVSLALLTAFRLLLWQWCQSTLSNKRSAYCQDMGFHWTTEYNARIPLSCFRLPTNVGCLSTSGRRDGEWCFRATGWVHSNRLHFFTSFCTAHFPYILVNGKFSLTKCRFPWSRWSTLLATITQKYSEKNLVHPWIHQGLVTSYLYSTSQFKFIFIP